MSQSSSSPLKKRRRQWHSCDTCRSRKVKCDANSTQDKCSNCREAGLECTFNYVTTRPTQTKQKMTDTLSRVAQLEALLQTARDRGLLDSLPSEMLDQVLQCNEQPSHTKGLSSNSTNGKDQERKRIPTVVNVEYLKDEFIEEDLDTSGLVSLSELSTGISSMTLEVDGETRFVGNTNPSVSLLQNVQLSEEFHKAYKNVQMSTQRLVLDHFAQELAYKQNQMTLPSRDITDHLVRVYFKTTHVLYPIIDKMKFLNQYHHEDPCPPSPLLLNAMLACACLHSEHPAIRAENGTTDIAARDFYTRAQRMLDLKYRNTSMETLTALVLLASHHFGDSMSGNIWLYTGMAIRMAYNLGLHRKVTYENMSLEDKSQRKLLWWHIYLTDRYVACALAKPSMVFDHDVDVDVPRTEDMIDHLPIFDEDPIIEARGISTSPDRAGLAKIMANVWAANIYFNKLLSIVLVKIHSAQALQRPPPVALIQDLERRMSESFLKFPPELTWGNPACSQLPGYIRLLIGQVNMIYHLIILLLHRPLISQTPWSKQNGRKVNSPRFIASMGSCNNAAQIITNVSQDLKKQGLLRYAAAFYYYVLFMSAVQHLIQFEGGDSVTRKYAAVNVRKNIACLWELRRTYINSGRLAMLSEDLLNDLEQKHKVVLQDKKTRMSSQEIKSALSPSMMSDSSSLVDEEEKARLQETYMPISKVLDSDDSRGINPEFNPRSLDELAESGFGEISNLLTENPDKYLTQVLTQPASPLIRGQVPNTDKVPNIMDYLLTMPMFDDGLLNTYLTNASMTSANSPSKTNILALSEPSLSNSEAIDVKSEIDLATYSLQNIQNPTALQTGTQMRQTPINPRNNNNNISTSTSTSHQFLDSSMNPITPNMIFDPKNFARDGSIGSTCSASSVSLYTSSTVPVSDFPITTGPAAAVQMASTVPMSIDMDEWEKYLEDFGEQLHS